MVGYKVVYYSRGKMREARFRGGRRALARANTFAERRRLGCFCQVQPWLELRNGKLA